MNSEYFPELEGVQRLCSVHHDQPICELGHMR